VTASRVEGSVLLAVGLVGLLGCVGPVRSGSGGAIGDEAAEAPIPALSAQQHREVQEIVRELRASHAWRIFPLDSRGLRKQTVLVLVDAAAYDRDTVGAALDYLTTASALPWTGRGAVPECDEQVRELVLKLGMVPHLWWNLYAEQPEKRTEVVAAVADLLTRDPLVIGAALEQVAQEDAVPPALSPEQVEQVPQVLRQLRGMPAWSALGPSQVEERAHVVCVVERLARYDLAVLRDAVVQYSGEMFASEGSMFWEIEDRLYTLNKYMFDLPEWAPIGTVQDFGGYPRQPYRSGMENTMWPLSCGPDGEVLLTGVSVGDYSGPVYDAVRAFDYYRERGRS
jgi:hypothetical protein